MSARSFDINKLNRKQSNIKVIKEDDKLIVLLHDNKVFELTNEGFSISSCGWKTPTTKTAINRALDQLRMNYRISAVKGNWFLNNLPFEDDMKITF